MSPTGITREEALGLLRRYVADPVMLKHSLASEAVLAALADHLGADRRKWATAGLLHDIDIDETDAEPTVHGREGARILEEAGMDSEIVTAVRRHNRRSTEELRQSRLDHALAAGETITGLIVATALILPDRKLASVQARSVLKRLKDRGFAPSVDRESILECEAIDVEVADLVRIALSAMQEISGELDL